jgi:hypothetical protein
MPIQPLDCGTGNLDRRSVDVALIHTGCRRLTSLVHAIDDIVFGPVPTVRIGVKYGSHTRVTRR